MLWPALKMSSHKEHIALLTVVFVGTYHEVSRSVANIFDSDRTLGSNPQSLWQSHRKNQSSGLRGVQRGTCSVTCHLFGRLAPLGSPYSPFSMAGFHGAIGYTLVTFAIPEGAVCFSRIVELVKLIDFPKGAPVFGAMALLSGLNQSHRFFTAMGQCKFKQ